MPRITINLNEDVNNKMREYIDSKDMSITTFITVAITSYLDNKKSAKNFENLFTEMFKNELEKKGLIKDENTIR